ncbi:hypothetical protein SHKM778_19900 [Streptomyces sp. KM77-8]|uniref:Uncharacterized protein n=1 Tax=Streptomyces haneummycinicus TaxID=3074435 RepID=A0AAT9HDQ7_9ACTN
MEVEPVEFLAERGDVLVDHDPQLLQRGPPLLLVAPPVAAGHGVDTRAAGRHQRSDGDQPADGNATAGPVAPRVRRRAAGVAQRAVYEVVQLGLGVPGALHGGDQVPYALPAQHTAVGTRVEPVAEPDAVQTGDAGLGAQILEEALRGIVRREHRDEDGFVRVLDLGGQGLGVGRGQDVPGRGVDVDRALPQFTRDPGEVRLRLRPGRSGHQDRQRGGHRHDQQAYEGTQRRVLHIFEATRSAA